MISSVDFANFIRAIPLDDIELAELLNVSVTTINRYRRGESYPHPILWTFIYLKIDEYMCMARIMGV